MTLADAARIIAASQTTNTTTAPPPVLPRQRLTAAFLGSGGQTPSGVDGGVAVSLTDVSSDGRYAAFTSKSSDFGVSYSGAAMTFVHDTTTRVYDQIGTGGSAGALLSDNGRYAFADTLIDTPGVGRFGRLLRFDRVTGTTRQIGIDNSGLRPVGISADGNVVATTLRGSGGSTTLQVDDLTTAETWQRTFPAGDLDVGVLLSDDGNSVVVPEFGSRRSQLVRWRTGTTIDLAINPTGGPISAITRPTSISADGSMVLFDVPTGNLDGAHADTHTHEMYLRNVSTSATTAIRSTDPALGKVNGEGTVAADDTAVAFGCGPGRASWHVCVYRPATGVTSLEFGDGILTGSPFITSAPNRVLATTWRVLYPTDVPYFWNPI